MCQRLLTAGLGLTGDGVCGRVLSTSVVMPWAARLRHVLEIDSRRSRDGSCPFIPPKKNDVRGPAIGAMSCFGLAPGKLGRLRVAIAFRWHAMLLQAQDARCLGRCLGISYRTRNRKSGKQIRDTMAGCGQNARRSCGTAPRWSVAVPIAVVLFRVFRYTMQVVLVLRAGMRSGLLWRGGVLPEALGQRSAPFSVPSVASFGFPERRCRWERQLRRRLGEALINAARSGRRFHHAGPRHRIKTQDKAQDERPRTLKYP